MEANRSFESYADFENYRKAWEKDTLQNFTKTKTRKFTEGTEARESIVYQQLLFACVHRVERPSKSKGELERDTSHHDG